MSIVMEDDAATGEASNMAVKVEVARVATLVVQ